MTALSADRNTPSRAGVEFRDPVAAAKTIYAGALVVLDSSGNAAPGSTATTLVARGMAKAMVDNSDGSAGDVSVEVLAGTFRFANSASTDEIKRADIGGDCYIVDDQTVAKTDATSTRSKAGTVADVDDDGVWVRIGI